jgi:hypothetical protein
VGDIDKLVHDTGHLLRVLPLPELPVVAAEEFIGSLAGKDTVGMRLNKPRRLLIKLSVVGARVLNNQAENQLKSSAYCHPISTIAPVLSEELLN